MLLKTLELFIFIFFLKLLFEILWCIGVQGLNNNENIISIFSLIDYIIGLLPFHFLWTIILTFYIKLLNKYRVVKLRNLMIATILLTLFELLYTTDFIRKLFYYADIRKFFANDLINYAPIIICKSFVMLVFSMLIYFFIKKTIKYNI